MGGFTALASAAVCRHGRGLARGRGSGIRPPSGCCSQPLAGAEPASAVRALSRLTAARWCLLVFEGYPDAPGGGGADALVNRECLLQVGGGFAGVAVLETAVADTFQSACFLHGHPDVASDRECLGVIVAGLAGGGGAGRYLAEAVERLGL